MANFTKSDLRYYSLLSGSPFFRRKSMQFFGDTMQNYHLIETNDYYILTRKKPVKCGLQSPAFFDKITYGKLSISDEKVESILKSLQ